MPPSPVSIIVPVYRTERVLPACLDSLLAQDFGEVEIIVIDDASPDNAGKVAAEYAGRDRRVRIVTNPANLGPYASRFAGCSAARGKYVAFCDSDDRMPPNAVRALYETAEKKQADMVHGRTRSLAEDRPGARLRVYDPFAVADGNGFARAILRNARGWNVWGKLYRLDAWNRAAEHLPRDKRLFYAEDLLISFALGLQAGTYAETGETVYLYRQPAQPADRYFADPDKARLHVANQLDVLAMLREMAAARPDLPDLPERVEFLSRYLIAAMLRNLQGSEELRAAVAADIAARVGPNRPAAAGGRSGRLPGGILARLRETGPREFVISLHRFLGAAKKRGWRRVLAEIRSL